MAKPKAQEPEELKRLTDYVAGSGVELEGRRLDSIDDILGDDVELQDFIIMPSNKFPGSEFAVMQMKHEEELVVTMTGGGAIVDKLKQMPKNYLPVAIKVVRKVSKSTGRKYLDIE